MCSHQSLSHSPSAHQFNHGRFHSVRTGNNASRAPKTGYQLLCIQASKMAFEMEWEEEKVETSTKAYENVY